MGRFRSNPAGSHRVAAAVLGAILVVLSAVAIDSALAPDGRAAAARRLAAVGNGYHQARAALAAQRWAVTDYYLLRLGPGAPAISARDGRRRHAEASASLRASLETLRRHGYPADRALARGVLASHRTYLAGVRRLFAAVDRDARRTATNLEMDVIEPLLGRMVRRTVAGAERHCRRASRAPEAAPKPNTWLLAGAIGVLGLGALPLLAFALRPRRTRRRPPHPAPRVGPSALIDELTEVRSRRAFDADLDRELGRRSRLGSPLSLVVLEAEGPRDPARPRSRERREEELKAIAACLVETLGGGDAVYRLSDDGFAVLLPGERAWGGFRFAQCVRDALAGSRAGRLLALTAGVAEATDEVSGDALLGRAELALLEAMRSRRASVIYTGGLEERPERRAEAEQHHLKTLTQALARAVDAKDSYTRSHSETVSETCALIGDELGLDPPRVSKLRLAGLLHDVGKIGMPDAILQKPAELSEAEFEVMKTHTTLGHDILSGAELEDEARWIRHHHERLDGAGYPDSLAGDDVPLESRIILVADAFEAMTSDRPYRRGRSEREAFVELERYAGSHFDPECVRALRRALTGRPARGRRVPFQRPQERRPLAPEGHSAPA